MRDARGDISLFIAPSAELLDPPSVPVGRVDASTFLLARRLIGWGMTQEVMSSANLLEARAMAERWDEDAEACEPAA